jgi:hypothetical protein
VDLRAQAIVRQVLLIGFGAIGGIVLRGEQGERRASIWMRMSPDA